MKPPVNPVSIGYRLVRGIAHNVTKADPDELQTSQQVHIRPYADLRDLETLQVLTPKTNLRYL